MYSIVTLALAMTDSTKLDSVKVQEPARIAFTRSGRLSRPSDHQIVAKVTKSVKAPEMLTTCYSSQYGSCWSEN